jgi:hypothetical protein
VDRRFGRGPLHDRDRADPRGAARRESRRDRSAAHGARPARRSAAASAGARTGRCRAERRAAAPSGRGRRARRHAAVESAPPSPASTPLDPKLAALDARIAELEQSIAADEAALGDYISDPERAKQKDESGDVSAIADRLPRLQDELRALKKQREAAAAGVTPHAP